MVSEARSYLGTPFRHQGRLKNVGVDCVGLLICVAKTLDIGDFDKTDYSRIPDGVILRQRCDNQMTAIAIDAAQQGDVLLFRFEKEPQHIAIVGDYRHGGLSIIHALAQSEKVIETRLDSTWKSRIVAAYQLLGVA